MTTCIRCLRPVTRPHRHHPNRTRYPRWTMTLHPKCHRAHHVESGDCARWGAMASTAGRRGYELALAACEDWHEQGGRARAAGARRDPAGRFMRRMR